VWGFRADESGHGERNRVSGAVKSIRARVSVSARGGSACGGKKARKGGG
jgi:hypothetical protein